MYKGQSGRSITLGPIIATGGEGEVFSIVGDTMNCIKLYHLRLRNKEKEEKLKYMSFNEPPNIEGVNYKICWPKDVIYKNGEFVGYMMPRAFVDSSLPYHLCQPKIPQNLSVIWHDTFDRKSTKGVISRLKLCTNIVAAVKRIHDTGIYVIVDIKPQNLLVTPSGKVSVIDLDSVQISEHGNVTFKAPVSTPEYTPPEAGELLSKKLPITIDWDVFSVGVVIYEILCGIHPYVGTAKPPNHNLNTLQEKIKNNITYLTKGKSEFNVLPTPHNTFNSYSVKLQDIIKKIFVPYQLGVSKRPKLNEIGERLFEEVKTYEADFQKQQALIKEREKENALANNKILKKENENLLNSIKNEQIKSGELQVEIDKLSEKGGGNAGWLVFLGIALFVVIVTAIVFNSENDTLEENIIFLEKQKTHLKWLDKTSSKKIKDLEENNKDLEENNKGLRDQLNSDNVIQFPFTATVIVDFANIHTSPNSSNTINWGWKKNIEITIRGLTNNGYYKIRYNYEDNGYTIGYIKATDVRRQ